MNSIIVAFGHQICKEVFRWLNVSDQLSADEWSLDHCECSHVIYNFYLHKPNSAAPYEEDISLANHFAVPHALWLQEVTPFLPNISHT